MKVNTFVIGTTDDFQSIEELIDYVDANGSKGFRKYQVIQFDAPDNSDPDTVTMIGRGHAFSNDWSMDDTFSFVIEGTLDEQAENNMFEEGVKARETSKKNVALAATWNPNDPTNW